MPTIRSTSRLFNEESKAQALAASLNSDEDDAWTYEAEAHGMFWQVLAYDEDGQRVGAL